MVSYSLESVNLGVVLSRCCLGVVLPQLSPWSCFSLSLFFFWLPGVFIAAHRLLLLQSTSSRALVLQSCGSWSVALGYMGSSQTRDGTHVHCNWKADSQPLDHEASP